MRAPKNLVKVKYTMGEKYVDSNFNPYTGYYCELQGKAYPGKAYTGKAKPLKLISSLNKDSKVNSYFFNSQSLINSEDKEGNVSSGEKFVLRYFIKYIHTIPIYIKEINADTYNSAKDNSLYQTVALKYDASAMFRKGGSFDMDEVEQADKKMSGIKLYLQDELV
jgi:hypothetical protein